MTDLRNKALPSRLIGRSVTYAVLITAIWFLVTGLSNAQAPSNWKQLLSDRLESEGSVSHLHLVGYFDGFLYADMYFAHDQNDWSGMLIFPEQSLQFDLEGGKMGDQLIFLEYDAEGRQTGYWTIAKKLNQYVGKWENLSRTMDFEMVMYDEFWNPEFKKDYFQKIVEYEGRIDGETWLFQVRRIHDDLTGLQFLRMAEEQMVNPYWECLDAFCNSFRLRFPAQNNTVLPEMEGQELGTYVQWTIFEGDGSGRNTGFSVAREKKTKLLSSLDQNRLIVVEYPVLTGNASQAYLTRIWEGIRDTLQQQFVLLQNDPDDVDNRWSHFAHARFEIYHWDESLLSGKWVIQRNWTDEKWSIPVNYLLRDGSFLTIRNQFKNDFDLDFFLLHFVQDQITQMPEYRDPMLRNKLDQANFEYKNIHPGGLIISTAFDTLFGPFELLVPYQDIEPYLRKRSELKKIMESLRND